MVSTSLAQQEPEETTNLTGASAPFDLGDVWGRASSQLKDYLGEGTYKSWVAPLTPKEFVSGCFVVSAPTRFIRDWLKTNCEKKILEFLGQEEARVLAVDIIVSASSGSSSASERGAHSQSSIRGVSSMIPTEAEEKTSNAEAVFSGGHLDPRLTFDNFIVGKPNELAYAAARRVADASEVTFNPLFLYGGVGLGKTHLMHAIAWHIRQKHPERQVMYLSAERFMYQFIRALRFRNAVAFKEQFRSVDVLMIDDVQFISGKDSTQEEFFHTFNALVDQKRQVIVSADKSPSDLEGMEERLKSRLGWGLVADIHPTTYELRLGILQAKLETLEAAVPLDAIEFLAHKITSNVRELEGALTRVVAHATLVGRTVTLDMVQEVLRDLLRSNERLITVEEIQRKVSEHYNIRTSEMHSSRRVRSLARPRQVAMFLAKRLTTHSLPEIGRKFGGRDHTTVMHAVKKIEELCEKDTALEEDINLLIRALKT
ncbi:MAG: chromosomal replication initiator protein DnaA [bacterium]|nr:chromosomal replication initiator protein DnaA [bacterium]